MSMQEFGFGDNDSALSAKGSRFKAKEGESYRLSFIWWPGLEDGKPNLDASSPKFIGCKRFYIQNVGYFQDNPAYPELAKLAGGQSKQTVGTIVVQWPTDQNGKLDKNRFQSGDYQAKSWIFSADKYRIIASGHEEYPLGQVDLNVSCTDTQFQKMTFLPTKENLLRKLIEANKPEVQALIARAREMAADLPREIAQDLTPDQVKAKLSGQGGAAAAGGRGPAAGGGGGGRGATTSPDFDGMLDDILK